MAKETQIGNLVIDLKIKTESLEKGLETAKKKLQEIEDQNEQVKKSNKGLDASFVAMAVGIVAALSKVKSAINSGVDAYKEYESVSKGLESIVKGQGLSFNNAQNFIKDYISDGLIPLADATLAYKNLAARGYNQEQIEKTMIALKDAAAFGRQSTYEYGQAIATATEGLKNENSILVDNAGVTKNVAKMWQDYAKSVGKTTEQLTQAEKIQAEVNGISEESKNQMGDAAKYAETYAGQQAKLNASMLELKKTFGEAIIPALQQLSQFLTPIIGGISSFIQNNQALTSGMTTFVACLGTASVAMLALKKAHDMLKQSTILSTVATQGFTAALKANPLFFIATTITTVVSVMASYNSAKKEQEEMENRVNESVTRYNQLKEGSIKYTLENTEAIKTELQELDEYKNKIKDTGEAISDIDWSPLVSGGSIFKDDSKLKERIELIKKYGATIEEVNEQIKNRENYLEEAAASEKIKDAIDIKSIKTQKQEAAQLKVNANEMQNYLNTVKKGDKNTSEYSNAVKELAKAYPEAANAEGIIIDQAQDFINAQQGEADQSWNKVNEIIKGNTEVINKYMEMARAAENDVDKQKQLANEIGLAYNDIIPTLTSVLNILGAIGNQKPEDVPNVKPTYSSYTPRRSSGGSKSYSNKALDDYKEYIEYKKSMGRISLQEEINMYRDALNNYAKITSERRDLEVKIHDLEKELEEQSLDNFIAKIEHKKALNKISLQNEIKQYEWAYKNLAKTQQDKWSLEEKIFDLKQELKEEEIEKTQQAEDKITEKLKNSLDERVRAIQDGMDKKEKAEGAAYTVVNRQKDYDRLIKAHQNYLDKILASEKVSAQKKKEIYQEELDAIKSIEEQKRNLRVSAIDSTVSQLKNALIKQLNEMQEADKKAIENNIKTVEKWKDTRINAINEEYNARIEAIQKELDLLDKSEQDKTRAEEDAEYQRKKNRLQELIAYEHDVTTKINYQKELEKLTAEYQKTLDKRTLDDKKVALKEKQDLLKEEQNLAIETVNQETEAIKDSYNKQLDSINEYYKKQQDLAQETAEKMLLNVDTNQSEIIRVLRKYGDQYEITGQSLGEKLAQGINDGLTGKIEKAIKNVQQKIDKALENKISKWTSIVDSTTKSGKTSSSKNVVVTQNNYIQQVQETPSETYRKLKNIEQKLADQLAGV